MILFQNENFIAVDKPAGWLTVPSRMPDADPRICLVDHLRKGLLFPTLRPVHRLDAEVSGLVLFAKTEQSHRAANAWFENREIQKFYEAIAEGQPSETSFEWKSLLLRGKKRAFESENGKEAITRAKFLGKKTWNGKIATHWRIEPLTGRSHQIRFHLAKAGFPILGDKLYGSTLEYKEGAIALRAVELDFTNCKGASDLKLPRKLLAEPLE